MLIPVASPPSVAVSGYVSNGDRQPVAGARVTVPEYGDIPPLAETVTDDAGAYRLVFATNLPRRILRIEHNGYEQSRFNVDLGSSDNADVRRDFSLHRVWHVKAGDTITFPIESTDPVCEFQIDEWWCRTIRIAQGKGAWLRVTSATSQIIVKSAEEIWSGSAELRMPLSPGEVATVNVLTARTPVNVTLHTASE